MTLKGEGQNEPTLRPETCIWPRCGCRGECEALGGRISYTPAQKTPASSRNRPILVGIDSKIDDLAASCSELALAIEHKADAERVAKVETGLNRVRWQLYAVAIVLAASEIALRLVWK